MFILGLTLLVFAAAAIIAKKAYQIVPPHELKRQARSGNELARRLYTVVGFGGAAYVLLRSAELLFITIATVLVVLGSPVIVSVPTLLLAFWLLFMALPQMRLSNTAMQSVVFVTPAVAWLLHKTNPLWQRIADWLQVYMRPKHSGLYELEDLLDLLELQVGQPDNRITTEEITLIRSVLAFNDTKIRTVLLPKKQVKTITAGDAIGPILLDELHAHGQVAYPVTESASKSQEFVGVAYVDALDIHSKGSVADYMQKKVLQVSDSDLVSDVLHQLYQAGQHAAVVYDSHESYVGIVTTQMILKTLTGQKPD